MWPASQKKNKEAKVKSTAKKGERLNRYSVEGMLRSAVSKAGKLVPYAQAAGRRLGEVFQEKKKLNLYRQ